jgi:hypothetical protein
MRKIRLWLYGFLVWLVPFVVAISLSGIKETNRPLFESIMPVVLALTVVVFLSLDFQSIAGGYLQRGVRIGLVWLAISIVLDLALFSSGPVRMSLAEYMQDIGLTYLLIPIITVSAGRLADRITRTERPAEANAPAASEGAGG